MTRILAIDYGEKRIGIAISDESRLIASPMFVLPNNNNGVTEILKLIKEKKVNKILVGLPEWDKPTLITKQIKCFVEKLRSQTKVEIEFVNEFYSTREAIEKIHDSGKKYKKVKNKIDAYSACVLLQNYLNEKRNEE